MMEVKSDTAVFVPGDDYYAHMRRNMVSGCAIVRTNSFVMDTVEQVHMVAQLREFRGFNGYLGCLQVMWDLRGELDMCGAIWEPMEGPREAQAVVLVRSPGGSVVLREPLKFFPSEEFRTKIMLVAGK